ncbi:MAG: efflux RND transporter periplasmic adaptor subunit [Bacteroidetes bacterium]|nr:efflux RND transporter periplasmic adaptor subunit [Bacteroidota bacterium]MBS1972754.1 efflux RND transporter periplasmic adaptor subunit [Bacteroidota bacterium]
MNKNLFFIIIALGFAACTSSEGNETDTAAKKTIAPVYQTAVIEKAGVSSVMKLPAQLAAYEEVSIFPKVNGYVKEVLVDIGSRVAPGQLLMTLEAPELLQATVQAKEKYARSKANFAISKEHYLRLLEAAKTPGAISPLDLSTAKENMQADSAQSNAEKANWEMQQTMMGYLRVVAPFEGVITQRNVHPGALVSANAKDNMPMLELKQTAHLRLQVDIPEALSDFLSKKDTVAFYVNALKGKKMTGIIVRTSHNINQQYRTERIEADVKNSEGLLAPGMYADVVFDAKGNPNALSVPKTAVITSTERKYVLILNDNIIRKVDVATGNENAASVEVYGKLQPGEKVIINANDEIKEGKVME